MDQPPPPVPQPTKTWWQRNWKWAVPAFGLGGIALVGGFIFFILNLVFGMFRSSDVYQQAVAKAGAAPAVVQALGAPLTEGFLTTGSIHISGPSGSAEMAIPVSGAKGEGTIYVSGTKTLGEWKIDHLIVEIKATGERIDLLNTHAAPQ